MMHILGSLLSVIHVLNDTRELSIVHLYVILCLQLLLYHLGKFTIVLIDHPCHLQYLLWVDMLSQSSHHFIVEQQISSIVEFLNVAQNYIKVKRM